MRGTQSKREKEKESQTNGDEVKYLASLLIQWMKSRTLKFVNNNPIRARMFFLIFFFSHCLCFSCFQNRIPQKQIAIQSPVFNTGRQQRMKNKFDQMDSVASHFSLGTFIRIHTQHTNIYIQYLGSEQLYVVGQQRRMVKWIAFVCDVSACVSPSVRPSVISICVCESECL